VCDKKRLLDLFENFILFDQSVGAVEKLVARNHQFIGVNKALAHLVHQRARVKSGLLTKEEGQRLGVFWHTQGSGKSYSMVFLAEKVHRKLGGSYTFVLVTDRQELDKQIYGTFAGVGAVADDKVRADTGAHLQALLKTQEKYIFTLIQKFNFDEEIKRENIIVISDEAHRTQGGTLAVNLRKVLPNASYMGFTGTPLFKDDQLTRRIFGEYVSVYDFQRSSEDGATVPLYYENRGEKLKLENPVINQQIREAIEAAELDADQSAKLERLFARDYPILTAEKRLRAIAGDVVEHFITRGYKGKAMFVAIDKVTAVKMYDFITEAWERYLGRRQKEIERVDDVQEKQAQLREWQWARHTEIAVVVSHEQNEIDKFRGWGLDIEPHRLKMNTRDLETEFKDEKHPFRLAIVCAMWITGFDVKSLSTLYLDKPLKSHTLMQTIARANRVHAEKNNGLIVDYIETYKALLEALAIYAVGGTKTDEGSGQEQPPVQPLEKLVAALGEVLDATVAFLKDEVQFDLDEIIRGEGVEKIAAIARGVNAVYHTDETKNKFGVLAREVFKKYKALIPNPAIYEFRPQRDAINAIYGVIAGKEYEADVTALVKQVQDVVDDSIASLNLALEPVEGYGNQVDLSKLDFKRIEQEFLKLGDKKNLAVQSLKDKVEKKLNRMLRQNPCRIDYYERYQKIIAAYNNGKEYQAIKEIFDQLVTLLNDLNEEQKRAVSQELSEEELAVFDMLGQDKTIGDKQKAELKEIAKKLLQQLQNNEFKVNRWIEKVQTASAVRKVINDYLFEHLPYPGYHEDDIAQKTDVLFNFFKEQYAPKPAA
jgi:type I restriction enzyme R subunit